MCASREVRAAVAPAAAAPARTPLWPPPSRRQLPCGATDGRVCAVLWSWCVCVALCAVVLCRKVLHQDCRRFQSAAGNSAVSSQPAAGCASSCPALQHSGRPAHAIHQRSKQPVQQQHKRLCSVRCSLPGRQLASAWRFPLHCRRDTPGAQAAQLNARQPALLLALCPLHVPSAASMLTRPGLRLLRPPVATVPPMAARAPPAAGVSATEPRRLLDTLPRARPCGTSGERLALPHAPQSAAPAARLCAPGQSACNHSMLTPRMPALVAAATLPCPLGGGRCAARVCCWRACM